MINQSSFKSKKEEEEDKDEGFAIFVPWRVWGDRSIGDQGY